MPTFLKRKYMRGRPRLLERTLGAGTIVILALIVASFLLTGGLFGGAAAKQGFVADIKAILGVPTEPLFSVRPGNHKPAPPPRQVRVGEALLPEKAGKYERVAITLGSNTRGCDAFSLTASDRTQGVDPPSSRQTTSQETSTTPLSEYEETLARAAAEGGGLWLFRGRYFGARGKDDYATALIVDMAAPEKARELFRIRRPAEASAVPLGREGWRSTDGRGIGFWSGRYYTELEPVTSQMVGTELGDIAAALAGRQLVYGGESFTPETATPSNGTSQPATPSLPPARQPPGQARFADPGDPAITVPSKIERYTDNLYEKIDGREGQYRSFNFVELRFAQYLDTRGQQAFDTYVYDMAEPVNAMGIYMVERSPDAKLIQLGREGYVSGTSAYFWKGKYYVNVLGPAEGDANAAKIALQIAQVIAASIADDGRLPWADKLLPTQDRLPDTLSYTATSALGYDFLQQLFKANYKTGETTYQAFLVKADNPAKAAELFKKLAEATAKYDKVVAQQASPGGETFTGQSLDVYSVCFHKGIYLGGIIECEDRALAERRAAELRDGLPAEGGT